MADKTLQVSSWEDVVNDNFEEVEVNQEVTETVGETSTETEVVKEVEVEKDNTSTFTDETKAEATTEEKEVVAEKVVEVEKVVEKIVEKYPEMDEYSQGLLTAIQEGKEDVVFSYLQEKFKNYDVMSDVDVVKEKLRKEFPHYSEKNIEAKFKAEYGRSLELKDLDAIDKELDPEEYKEALKHNQAVEEKLDLLEVSASDARKYLNEQKKNVVLPKITTEVKQPEVKEPTAEEIAEANAKWDALVDSEVPKIQDYKFKVDGEEVVYKLTEEDRKGQIELMKSFDSGAWAAKRGWINEDGTENVKRIAEDVHKLENIERIIASSATQIKTATTKEVIKDIKNLDLDGKSRAVEVKAKSFEDAVFDA